MVAFFIGMVVGVLIGMTMAACFSAEESEYDWLEEWIDD